MKQRQREDQGYADDRIGILSIWCGDVDRACIQQPFRWNGKFPYFSSFSEARRTQGSGEPGDVDLQNHYHYHYQYHAHHHM
jgi:hypothetical protein